MSRFKTAQGTAAWGDPNFAFASRADVRDPDGLVSLHDEPEDIDPRAGYRTWERKVQQDTIDDCGRHVPDLTVQTPGHPKFRAARSALLLSSVSLSSLMCLNYSRQQQTVEMYLNGFQEMNNKEFKRKANLPICSKNVPTLTWYSNLVAHGQD